MWFKKKKVGPNFEGFIFDPLEDITAFELSKLIIYPSPTVALGFDDKTLRHLRALQGGERLTRESLDKLYGEGFF